MSYYLVGWVKRSETGATTSGLPLHSQKSLKLLLQKSWLLGFVTSTQPTTYICFYLRFQKQPIAFSRSKSCQLRNRISRETGFLYKSLVSYRQFLQETRFLSRKMGSDLPVRPSSCRVRTSIPGNFFATYFDLESGAVSRYITEQSVCTVVNAIASETITPC
ncbi:MAG: hypothetical protein ACRCT1_17420 [Microcoleaceae cyanobacterium]